MHGCDFLVIGGGIAGASIGYQLSAHGRVVVLEMEPTAGYHSSGRSASFLNLSLGGALTRALTAISRRFLVDFPAGFAEHALTEPCAALTVASAGQDEALRTKLAQVQAFAPRAHLVRAATIAALVPIARIGPDAIVAGFLDPDGCRIDGHGLLQSYLRAIRRAGGQVLTNAATNSLHYEHGKWTATTPQGSFAAPIVINAAGAWGDRIATLAGIATIGLIPRRRTVVTFDGPPGVDCSGWPFVRALDETFYFVPESGALLASPADETPVDPCDVQPEEIDVATAVERFENVTTLVVRRLRSKWAGLRTFVRDRLPVAGFDPQAPGFFWYVGQGGIGLQTAPALSEAAASLIVHGRLSPACVDVGLTRDELSVERLAGAAGSGG